MTHTANAVVIGTGVIGAAVAYELAQTGLRVVAIDRLGDVGSGSTSSSSSIVRFHYSTFEGVAASWESKFGWENWPEYLGSRPEESLARFIKTGCLILDGSTQRERVLPLFNRVRVPYQCWDAETIRQRIRVWIPDGTVRPSRSRTPHSGRMPTANSVPTTRPTAGSSTTRNWRRGTSWPRRSGGGPKFSSANRWWGSSRRMRASRA